MSLINEALKKAERARTGGLEETPPPSERPVIAKRGRTIGTRTLVALGGVVVLLLAGGVIALFLRPAPEAPRNVPASKSAAPASAPEPARPIAPVAPAAAATTPSTEPKSPTASEVASTTPASTGTVAVAAQSPQPAPAPLPAATPSAAAPGVPAVTPTPLVLPAPAAPVPAAPAAAPTPAATSTLNATTVATAPAKPRADDRIADHVDRMRILGVRSPGPEARVLIGERVYRVNDVVDRALGLRLQKVEPGVITFADAAGSLYVKNY